MICPGAALTSPEYTLASRIVEAVLRDLNDRRGIKNELQQIDEDVRVIMRSELVAVVRAVMEG